MDGAVLDAIKRKVLTPKTIEYVADKTAELVKQSPRRIKQVKAELRKVNREVEQYLDAIGAGHANQRLFERVEQREQRIKELEREPKP